MRGRRRGGLVSTSVRNLFTNRKGQHINVDVEEKIQLWPDEAHVEYRLRTQGSVLEFLLTEHEKTVQTFTSFVENIKLDVVPTLTTKASLYSGEEDDSNNYGYPPPPRRRNNNNNRNDWDQDDSNTDKDKDKENEDDKEKGKEKEQEASAEGEPPGSPKSLTQACEKIVLQAVTKENVFQLLEACPSVPGVNTFCMRYIARNSSLRKAALKGKVNEDIKQEIEKYLRTFLRVKRKGPVLAPREPDHRRYNQNQDAPPVLSVYEDVHVIIPLPLPPQDQEEEDIVWISQVNARVGRLVDILYDKKWYPVKASGDQRYYDGNNHSLAEWVYSQDEFKILKDSSLIEKLHEKALQEALEHLSLLPGNSLTVSLADLTDCNIEGSAKEVASAYRYGHGDKHRVYALKYAPITHEIGMNATFAISKKN